MLLMQSLNKLDSPEEKLQAIIKKHAELVSGLNKGEESKKRKYIVALIKAMVCFQRKDIITIMGHCVCAFAAGGASQ